MSRSERLLDLVQTLRRHRRPVSGQTLAFELGISIRTLYRDIASLRAQGASIDAEPGLGFVLRPGYMLPPLMFPDDEIEALVLGSRWVAERADPRLAEAWDLIVFGTELATAYSELVDPVVQRERLTTQSLLAAAGDVEAMQIDEDFLRAMEYGMPPTGGMGMGIDRLLMTLTGTGIRETILYPLVRAE